jgi:DNA-binding transcriptional LysR family regulator
MRISLDSLRVLDAIDRNNSFAAAAEELNRVPSAITYAIKQLELDLEVKIYDRSGYRAQLTPIGKDLLAGGRSLLEQAQVLEKKIRVSAGLANPNLQIAYDDVLSFDGVQYVLGAVLESFPEISINLSAEILNGCKDALLFGSADLVVGYLAEPPRGSPYRFEFLGNIPFVFAVAPQHPLAHARELLTHKEISSHRIVIVPDTSRTIPKTASGYAPDRQFLAVPSMECKAKAQVAGLGVGFLPLSLAKPYLQKGLLIEKEVDQPKVDSRCYLAWRENKISPALEFAINIFRKNKDKVIADSVI